MFDFVELKLPNNSKGDKGCCQIVCINKKTGIQDYSSGLEQIQIPHRHNQKEKKN